MGAFHRSEKTVDPESAVFLCICQCGVVREPYSENRVYVFHSRDEGKSRSKKEFFYPTGPIP